MTKVQRLFSSEAKLLTQISHSLHSCDQEIDLQCGQQPQAEAGLGIGDSWLDQFMETSMDLDALFDPSFTAQSPPDMLLPTNLKVEKEAAMEEHLQSTTTAGAAVVPRSSIFISVPEEKLCLISASVPGVNASHSPREVMSIPGACIPPPSPAFIPPPSSIPPSPASIPPPPSPDSGDPPPKDVGAIPRHKRPSHKRAELKRRDKIKTNLDEMKALIPDLKDKGKTSEVDILIKAAAHYKVLMADSQRLSTEAEDLRREIKSLSSNIHDLQEQLPAGGLRQDAPVDSSHTTLTSMYQDFRSSAIANNWKFYLFDFLARPMLESYKDEVSMESPESFCQSVQKWTSTRLGLVNFRTQTLESMRDICRKTSILTTPASLKEEALASIGVFPESATATTNPTSLYPPSPPTAPSSSGIGSQQFVFPAPSSVHGSVVAPSSSGVSQASGACSPQLPSQTIMSSGISGFRQLSTAVIAANHMSKSATGADRQMSTRVSPAHQMSAAVSPAKKMLVMSSLAAHLTGATSVNGQLSKTAVNAPSRDNSQLPQDVVDVKELSKEEVDCLLKAFMAAKQLSGKRAFDGNGLSTASAAGALSDVKQRKRGSKSPSSPGVTVSQQAMASPQSPQAVSQGVELTSMASTTPLTLPGLGSQFVSSGQPVPLAHSTVTTHSPALLARLCSGARSHSASENPSPTTTQTPSPTTLSPPTVLQTLSPTTQPPSYETQSFLTALKRHIPATLNFISSQNPTQSPSPSSQTNPAVLNLNHSLFSQNISPTSQASPATLKFVTSQNHCRVSQNNSPSTKQTSPSTLNFITSQKPTLLSQNPSPTRQTSPSTLNLITSQNHFLVSQNTSPSTSQVSPATLNFITSHNHSLGSQNNSPGTGQTLVMSPLVVSQTLKPVLQTCASAPLKTDGLPMFSAPRETVATDRVPSRKRLFEEDGSMDNPAQRKRKAAEVGSLNLPSSSMSLSSLLCGSDQAPQFTSLPQPVSQRSISQTESMSQPISQAMAQISQSTSHISQTVSQPVTQSMPQIFQSFLQPIPESVSQPIIKSTSQPISLSISLPSCQSQPISQLSQADCLPVFDTSSNDIILDQLACSLGGEGGKTQHLGNSSSSSSNITNTSSASTAVVTPIMTPQVQQQSQSVVDLLLGDEQYNVDLFDLQLLLQSPRPESLQFR